MFDAEPLSHQRDGVGVYTVELLRALAKLDPAMELVPGALGLGRPPTLEIPGVRPPRRIALPERAIRASWRALGWPAIDGRLPGIDLYHGTNFRLLRLARIPTVLTIHDLHFLERPAHARWERRLAGDVRWAAAAATRIIADSDATRRQIARHFPRAADRVEVVYPGLPARSAPAPGDVARVRAAAGLPERYLLFVGRTEPRKNLPVLVRAFARARAGLEGLTLAVAGVPGSAEADLRAAIDAAGVGPHVRRLGFVADADLPALYAGAAAFLYPSRWEGFGFPVLEAFAAGAPVVASDVGSIPEVAGDAALLCPPDDEEAFAAALRRILADPGLAARLRALGAARVPRFRYEVTAERTRAVYLDAARAADASRPTAS